MRFALLAPPASLAGTKIMESSQHTCVYFSVLDMLLERPIPYVLGFRFVSPWDPVVPNLRYGDVFDTVVYRCQEGPVVPSKKVLGSLGVVH